MKALSRLYEGSIKAPFHPLILAAVGAGDGLEGLLAIESAPEALSKTMLALVCILGLRPASSAPSWAQVRQHTSAYVSIRQHTSAYASIRQHA